MPMARLLWVPSVAPVIVVRTYGMVHRPDVKNAGPFCCASANLQGERCKLIWLGRQLADHLGSDPGMLWVRIPPELLGGLRLEARGLRKQGCTLGLGHEASSLCAARYANRQSGEAQTFVTYGFDSHLCHGRLEAAGVRPEVSEPST
jgi:hypothetical protein